MESRFFGKRLSWPLQILVWALSLYVAWMVIPKGYGKLADYSALGFFESLGLSFEVMIAVGIVEVFGVLMMFIPRISFYGATSVFIVLSFAAYYDGGLPSTIALVIISLIVAVLTRPGILRKKPEITKVSI